MDPNDRAALALATIALAIAIIAASAITLERVNTRPASNDAPPGTVGLARPHPPLDRAPGEPIQTGGAPSGASIRQHP
jgi:hypothetical protein